MMTPGERVVARYLEAKAKLDLDHWGLGGILKGQAVTLYHGTTRLFKTFDMSVVREELVNKFYGAGIFLTPSKRVAADYANANRNMGFPPSIVEDLKRKNQGAGAFLEALYRHGKDAWDKEYSPEGLGMTPEQIQRGDYGEVLQRATGGVDPNILQDISPYIEGSKMEALGSDEPVNIFNMSTGLPDYMYQSLDEVGLNSKTYRPKVYTVSVVAKNPIVTANDSVARSAKSKGYDCVVYHGRALVQGVPEVAVFNPSQVRVKHIEVL